MLQKGFDNIVYLSGGIEDFGAEFPESLEGPKIPQLNINPQSRLIRRKDYGSAAGSLQGDSEKGKNTAHAFSADQGLAQKEKAG